MPCAPEWAPASATRTSRVSRNIHIAPERMETHGLKANPFALRRPRFSSRARRAAMEPLAQRLARGCRVPDGAKPRHPGSNVGLPGGRAACLDPYVQAVLSAPRQVLDAITSACCICADIPNPTRVIWRMRARSGVTRSSDVVWRLARCPGARRVGSAAKLERLGRPRDAGARIWAQCARRAVRGALAGRQARHLALADGARLRLWRCSGRASDIPSSPSGESGSRTREQRRTRTAATVP